MHPQVKKKLKVCRSTLRDCAMAVFSETMQLAALQRQQGRCASCGTAIKVPAKAGTSVPEFIEGAGGHHMIPEKLKGPTTIENCIGLCKACRNSVYRGGQWKYAAHYKTIEYRPISDRIAAISRLFSHYR